MTELYTDIGLFPDDELRFSLTTNFSNFLERTLATSHKRYSYEYKGLGAGCRAPRMLYYHTSVASTFPEPFVSQVDI
jgi:hypothetical protein